MDEPAFSTLNLHERGFEHMSYCHILHLRSDKTLTTLFTQRCCCLCERRGRGCNALIFLEAQEGEIDLARLMMGGAERTFEVNWPPL